MTPEELKNITPADFYEKYWKIQTKDGTISPPPLTDKEKAVLNQAAKGEYTGVHFFRKRRRQVFVDMEYFKEQYEKLPEYIKLIKQ